MIRHVLAALVALVLGASTALAQQFWVQIEARPSLPQAEERTRAWSNSLPNVAGYALRSGWYAVALGPYSEADASAVLASLRASGQIPGDSFLANGANFRRQFWPPGATPGASGVVAVPQSAVPDLTPADQSPAQARRAEALLLPEDRRLVQTALLSEGFYDSTVDGAFGRGTRAAMADWQAAYGYERTGVLTTGQRAELVDGYRNALASLRMTPITDQTAGIAMDIPAGVVVFDRYAPPFAHYAPMGDNGVRIALISQSGDRTTLAGLYEILQTLSIVPLDGPRTRRDTSFTITGQNAETVTTVEARLQDGMVKGFLLAWPAGDERRRRIALEAMRRSFQSLPGAVLPDTVGDGATQSIDLVSGLEIRRPSVTRSGFYVTQDGAVLTTADAVDGCSRVTLDETYDATVVASDASLGLALLRPQVALSPPGVAQLRAADPRLQSEVALAGYSYDGILGAPALTFGVMADTRGLQGEENLTRLALAATDSDAGGPIMDTTGSVVGLLLPPAPGPRQLPDDVAFAADGASLEQFLAANGIAVVSAAIGADLDPEDLTAIGTKVTVLVSCWK